MTPTARKWAALGAVVLVLGAGAGIFLQQAQNRIETEVRAALAGLPGLKQQSVEAVRFDVVRQTLTLKNLRLTMQHNASTSEMTVEELAVVSPNLKALQGDTSAGLLLAEEVRATGYAASTTANADIAVHSRVAAIRIVQPQGDMAALSALAPAATDKSAPLKGADIARGLRALGSFRAASLRYTDISTDMTMPGLLPLRAHMDSMEGKDVSPAYIGSFLLTNWEVRVGQKGSITVGAVELTHCSPPDLGKLPPRVLQNEDMTPQEARQALMDIMPRDKPLIGLLTVRDVKESISGGHLSLKRLALENVWHEPLRASLHTEELNMPARLLGLPIINMLGYSRLVLSQEISLRPVDEQGEQGKRQLRLSVNMDVQDAGKLHLLVDMQDAADAAATLRQRLSKLLLHSARAVYTDAGLAARSVRLAQNFMGMTPAMIVEMARASAPDIVGRQAEDVTQFMNFVQRPGEITFSLTPAVPAPINELDSVAPSALRVTSTPGPKTLDELAHPKAFRISDAPSGASRRK